MKHKILSYEEWYERVHEDIYTELEITGVSNELGYDEELEFEKRYEQYVELQMLK